MSKAAIAGYPVQEVYKKKENVSIAWLPVHAKVNFVSTGIEMYFITNTWHN